MNVPYWVARLAADFWDAVGSVPPFPRDLGRVVGYAFPLTVHPIEALSTARVQQWLCSRNMSVPLDATDRRLQAGLFARGGAGFIFLDSADDEREQRFSLAHELAHFLRHYWQPRQQGRAALGEPVLEVFDGKRLPHPSERLGALLANVPLGCHVHLMARDERVAAGPIAVAEEEADRLAYELLAPAELVAVKLHSVEVSNRQVWAANVLQEVFGLPPGAATAYAALLVPEKPADPLLGWLRKNL